MGLKCWKTAVNFFIPTNFISTNMRNMRLRNVPCASQQKESACYVGRNRSAESKANSEAAHQYLEKLNTVGVRHVATAGY
jgi:hypothetical protein